MVKFDDQKHDIFMRITRQTKIPFSRYKNTRLRDLPDGFLQWLTEKLMESDFHEWSMAARDELQRRTSEGTAVQSLEEAANELLRDAGYNPHKL